MGMTGNVYVGPAGAVEEYPALSLCVDWPGGVESARSINGHGIVDIAKGGMIAAVVIATNGRVRAGTVVVIVPESYNYAGSIGGGQPFARWMSPGNGLVSVPYGLESQAAVEVRLREPLRADQSEPPPAAAGAP